MKRIISILLCVCMFTVIASAQDNGNNFELSWSVDFSVFKGDQGRGLYAYAGTDIDKDGHKEFLVYDKVSGLPSFDRLLCFEAVGNDDFALVWSQQYARWFDDEGHGLTVADLDNDGNEEVIVSADVAIHIYEWDGTTFESGGGLPTEPTATIDPLFDGAGNAWIRQIRVVNLDSDPVQEIFLGYFGGAGLYSVIMSLPSQDFAVADWTYEFADDFTPWRCGGISIADFDGDGNMEIWSSHFDSEPATRVYESDGADNYVIKSTTIPSDFSGMVPPFESAFANAIFHDFDGDGNGELIISDVRSETFIITAESSSNFQDFGPSAYQFLLKFPDVQVNGFQRSGFMGDLDQDGKPDIYYNAFTARAVLDLEYQGGPVTDSNSWIPYTIYTGHRLVYGNIFPGGDLDGDGKEEIVIAGNGDLVANLQIIENQDAVTHVEEPISQIPSQFTLYQNTPNPFNPSTRIRFDIAEPGEVKLEIHDVLGRKLRTLVADMRAAGPHEVIWDGLDDLGQPVGSGQYFYTLRAGDFYETRKLMLIK